MVIHSPSVGYRARLVENILPQFTNLASRAQLARLERAWSVKEGMSVLTALYKETTSEYRANQTLLNGNLDKLDWGVT